MAENNYAKTWQIFPTQLILHALSHAEKNTDFDKLVAYLTLDVGVEMTIKTFLEKYHYRIWNDLKKEVQKSGRDIRFCDIVEAVGKTNINIQGIDIADANHYHNLRNDLYHKGGFPPPEEDLKRYLELAQKLLNVLLDVNFTDIELSGESKYIVKGENF
jgi:hypothetical protein